MDARAWHALTTEEVIEVLGTDAEKGLSVDEVPRLKKAFGENYFEKTVHLTVLRRIARYMASPLVFILVAAFAVALFVHEYVDAIVIVLAVLINLFVGLYQEGRTDRAFERLSSSQERFALVVRDGKTFRIHARDIVPGDLVLVRAGDIVPADMRLVFVRDVFLNEAALTGESAPVEKDIESVAHDAPITEQNDMAWMGTSAVSGSAHGVVVATGAQTKIGQIAQQLQSTHDTQTPIQRNIGQLARVISIIIGAVVAVIFILGVIRGEPAGEMLILAIAIAVSAIPEGLPAAVAASLAVGVERLLSRGGLVRTIVTAETLGSTTFILTDKTGTLTRAEMTFKSAHVPDVGTIAEGDVARDALALGACASDVVFENTGTDEVRVLGRPMEKIMTETAVRFGTPADFDSKNPIVGALPFTSRAKFGAYVREDRETGKRRMYIAGAPELLLVASESHGINEKHDFGAEQKKRTQAFFEEESTKGYRILAVGWKDVSKTFDTKDITPEEALKHVVFGGLLLFEDPLRFDAPESVRVAQAAGATIRMLTGDNPSIAHTIAQEVGITSDGHVVTGQEIEEMSDDQLLSALRTHAVFARVLPLQKMRIAKVLKDAGEVVAMTGDGINDAPALKTADIGVALGSGTEVAKEASDLVLMHDSFSIIVAAIEEGRRIMDNLKKMVTHMLSTSFHEIIVIGGAIVAGFALPILPVQVLWLNIIQEGVLSFAFSFEPAEPDVLRRNPRSPYMKTLLTREVKIATAVSGIIAGGISLVFYFVFSSFGFPIEYIRTVMFGVLSLDAVVFALSLKSLREPIWKVDLLNNRYLLGSMLLNTLLLIAALTFPPLQGFLSLTSPGLLGWIILISSALVFLCVIEAVKFFVFRPERRDILKSA